MAVNFVGQLHLAEQRMRSGLVFMGVLLAACGGARGQVAPAPEADASLRTFLQAAADSNVNVMAEHWGTSRGSAARTGKPDDYQKRVMIMQAFLKGTVNRIVGTDPVLGENNQRLLQVELTRNGCVAVVPFTMIRTGRGDWLVKEFNLELVPSPSRGCEGRDSTQH
jgi:hypothetical protein